MKTPAVFGVTAGAVNLFPINYSASFTLGTYASPKLIS